MIDKESFSMKLAFVFTNFNSSQYSNEAIHSIVSSANNESYIVIIDNKSNEENVELLKATEKNYGNVRVIYNDTNVGYFGGLNIGIRYVRSNYKGYDYIVVGNNDLIFPPDFFCSVHKNKERFSRYPVISPNIVTLDGFHQNPHVIKKISKIREIVYDLYHLNYYLACLIKKIKSATQSFTDRKDEHQHDVAQEIYQGYGACYILGPLFFEHFEELWAPTFMMHEEFILSKQLESKGFRVYYEPSISLQHHWHATMDKVPSKKRWKMAHDAHKVYRKYLKI